MDLNDSHTLRPDRPAKPGMNPPDNGVGEDSAKTADATRLPAGTLLEGRFRYRVENRLGKGGFGSVYMAECLGHDAANPETPPSSVVIKFINPPQGQDPAAILKRELSALLALEHPRIIRLYDWSTEAPAAFMVLEYFPLGSLHDAGYWPDGLGERSVWRILGDVLDGLHAAHAASILHLDIKPGNLLLDGTGGYVMTDFGISQGNLVSRNIVDTGIGSLGFQAPEQRHCKHEMIGPRTDLWGLGATAYAAWTGVRLDRHEELFVRPTDSHPYGLPMMGAIRPCPAPLEETVMSLLAVDPARRPGGAAEVLARVRLLRGGSADSLAAAVQRGIPVEDGERAALLDSLVDPLWSSICRARDFQHQVLRFSDGDRICAEGESSHTAFLLLLGRIDITRDGVRLASESREGTFLGEVATLTGRPRTATLTARGETFVVVFNAAELEQFATRHPAVGIRLIRSLATRLASVSAPQGKEPPNSGTPK